MKNKITITIDDDLYEKLKIYADKDKRTLSSLINKILSDFLKREG